MSLKFTIIIPCYNAESWIETSILSALGQTYEDLEVIFVDNESTDNSLEIAKKIQKKYPSLIIDTAPNLYKYSWEEPVEKAYSKELHNKGILRWDSKNYLGAVDYDLYFNIAHHNYFIYPFPKWIGYYYRWHDNQATWGMHKEPTDYDTLIKKVWKDKWKVN